MKIAISQTLKKLRKERNITQAELAAEFGVTCQSVCRWENGAAYPDIELIPEIAAYFGISTDVLLGCDNESVEKYIQRCDINFEDFVGLEASENLFTLYRAYFDDFTYSTESLEALEKYMTEILESEDAIISEINNNRTLNKVILVCSFIVILAVWENKKVIIDKVKGKVKEDEK